MKKSKHHQQSSSISLYPDSNGYFGEFGGRFVPEILRPALLELEEAFLRLKDDPQFIHTLHQELQTYVGRPTPLYYAHNLTQHFGGARIFLKREDLAHTGAHKINNTVGQILLARAMNKQRIIAETGAGQHGVATATVAAKYGLDCTIYMGEEDMERQAPNVQRMRMLGAEVVPVRSGTRTLKDATNEALRDWLTHVAHTHYIIGSVVGPHPFPMVVKHFQQVIGEEARKQIQQIAGRLPDYLIACVGGGSNAMGLFAPFLQDTQVKMIGVEAGGKGNGPLEHAASLTFGRPGIFHGMRTYLLQTDDGQVQLPYSISAGLDYPGVGPEHSYLKTINRVHYVAVSDQEALEAAFLLTRLEGIIPALESAHALAYLPSLIPETTSEEIVIVNLSGRGDKDMNTYIQHMEGGSNTR